MFQFSARSFLLLPALSIAVGAGYARSAQGDDTGFPHYRPSNVFTLPDVSGPKVYRIPTRSHFTFPTKPTPARITIRVPADAIVTIDGAPTQAVGAERTYETAELQWPTKYRSLVKVSSQGREKIRTLQFSAANALHVDFRPDFEPESANSHGSPEAVFSAFINARSPKAAAECRAPEWVLDLAASLAGVGNPIRLLIERDDANGKLYDLLADYDNILTNHGLTPQLVNDLKPNTDPDAIAVNKKVIGPIVADKSAFLGDLMAWTNRYLETSINASPDNDQGGYNGLSLKDTYDSIEVINLKVTNDTATATVVLKRQGMENREVPVEFVRVRGNWFLGAW